jgi:seryl-tRNA synthetase
VLGSVQNYYENKHEGWTLLQFAAENGAIDVAKFLIGKNASRQGKNGRDYIDIATQNSHAKFVNEMRKMELETLRATINSQSQKISQSKNPDDTKETALLKKEIFDLNEVIQKFEVFKEKAEEDILKLVEKYNYLVKKYEGKSEEDQENSSKSLGLGIK